MQQHFHTSIRISLAIMAFSMWLFPFPGIRCRDLYVISVETKTSAAKYVSCELTTQFIRRGCQGVTGYLYVNEAALDENLIMEARVGYNSERNSNFGLTPFHVRPQSVLAYLNGFYREYMMRSLANCSNALQSETGWQGLEGIANNYTFDKCLLDIATFPRLRSGYYCVTSTVVRDVPPLLRLDTSIVVKIEEGFQ